MGFAVDCKRQPAQLLHKPRMETPAAGSIKTPAPPLLGLRTQSAGGEYTRRYCPPCQAAARTARPGPVRIRRSREHQPCLPVRFLPLGPTPHAGRTCHAGTLVILQHTPRPVKSKSPGGRRPRNSPDKAARLRARGKNGPAKGRQQIRPCAGTLYPQFLGGAAKSRKNHAFLERGCRN